MPKRVCLCTRPKRLLDVPCADRSQLETVSVARPGAWGLATELHRDRKRAFAAFASVVCHATTRTHAEPPKSPGSPESSKVPGPVGDASSCLAVHGSVCSMDRAATPQGRVEIALELYSLAESQLRAQLARKRPTLSRAEIERRVKAWRQTRRSRPDAVGRVIEWPRGRTSSKRRSGKR